MEAHLSVGIHMRRTIVEVGTRGYTRLILGIQTDTEKHVWETHKLQDCQRPPLLVCRARQRAPYVQQSTIQIADVQRAECSIEVRVTKPPTPHANPVEGSTTAPGREGTSLCASFTPYQLLWSER